MKHSYSDPHSESLGGVIWNGATYTVQLSFSLLSCANDDGSAESKVPIVGMMLLRDNHEQATVRHVEHAHTEFS